MKYILFSLFTLFFLTATYAQVSEQEFQALKSLYNATDGDNWKNREGWENINTTATKDDVTTDWKGIGQIIDGHVIYLKLRSNRLNGFIPPQIGQLIWLQSLSLGDNQLQGMIPYEIGNLTDLRDLEISQNQLIGPFPDSFRNLDKLEFIYMNTTPLNCDFPNDIIASLPKLYYFDANDCGLTGHLEDIFDSIPNLSGFGVGQNMLSGPIPASLNRLKFIQSLYLSNNEFTGELPTLDSCANLYYITLNNNHFQGTLSDAYGHFPKLKYLHLSSNELSGPIPTTMFTDIFTRLWISDNYFTFEGIEPIYNDLLEIQNQYLTNKLFPLNESIITIDDGAELTLNAADLSVFDLGGNNNRYKWFHNNMEVYSGNDPGYHLDMATATDAGVYRFEVRNTVVTDLVLKSENVLLSVLVEGNHAPTDILLNTLVIDENYTGYVGNLSAVDPDENETHVFSLVSGNGTNDRDNYHFSINGNSLTLNSPANFENHPTLKLLVSANDLKGGIVIKPLEISLNDVNEAPYFSGQLTENTIDETAPNGTVVLPLLAYDPEGNPVVFSIASGNQNGAFEIQDNKLLVADNTQLNYDQLSQYILEISASDGTLATQITVYIHLSKINQVPTIESDDFTIDENTPAGTLIGTIVATDPEGENITLSILAGNLNNAFSLSGNNLLIENAEAIDYDANPVFHLLINASDGISNVQGDFFIHLNNLIDETGNDITSFSVPGMVGQAMIDATGQEITAVVSGQDLSSIPVTFTLSKGAVGNPVSGSYMNLLAPGQIVVSSETGVQKTWLVGLSFPSNVPEMVKIPFRLYPNPAGNTLYLQDVPLTSTVTVFTALGDILITQMVTEPTVNVDISALLPGSYFVRVASVNGQYIQAFVKM